MSCSLCNTQYRLEPALQKHLKAHREENLTCIYCLTVLKNAADLYEHHLHCLLRNNILEEQENSYNCRDYPTDTLDDVCKNQITVKKGVKRKKKESSIDKNSEHSKEETFTRRKSKRIIKKKTALKETGNFDDNTDSCIVDIIQEVASIEEPCCVAEAVKKPEQSNNIVEEGSSAKDHIESDNENKVYNGSVVGPNKYVCMICKMSFSSPNSYKRHGKVHSDKKSYRCEECNRTFKWPQSLTSHLRIHTGDKPFSCKWCSQTFRQKGTLKQHLRSHTGEKIFRCRFCDSGFTRSTRLKIHEMSHTGERPYKCDQCESAFADPQIYKKHMMNHQGLKPFSCNVCGMAFVMARYLNEHMKRHTGEKKYLCAVCATAFPNAGRLRRHMLVHTREKAFQCQYCEMEFKYREALKEHIDKHYGAKPYLCTECGKSFTHRTGLTQHKWVHSSEMQQTCVVCFKSFKTKNKLNRHMKTHPNFNPDPVDAIINTDMPSVDTVIKVTKGAEEECPVIEIVPLSTNIENMGNIVTSTAEKNVPAATDSEPTQDSIQPLIQAINQALASQQDTDVATVASVAQQVPHTVTQGSDQTQTLSHYTTVGLLQQASSGSMYQVVSPGGDVLYQSVDNDLVQRLTNDTDPELSVSDMGVTIMQIQVPSVQQEIQIPQN